MASETKIAVLDDYQGISKAHLEKVLAEFPNLNLEVFQDTLPSYTLPTTSQSSKDELVKRLEPYTIISTMRERTAFPKELLERLPKLKLLLTTGMKNAAIDMVAAKERGIIVTGTGNKLSKNPVKRARELGGPSSTGQHTLALILALTNRVAIDNANVRAGGWQSGFSTSLPGKTLGLLGLGRLGIETAKLGKAFGLHIIAWSTSLTQEVADEKARAAGFATEDSEGQKTFKVVSKEELFKESDILSVHYVLSERSRGIVSAKDLSLLKPTAFIVNTSRGPLIDEDALHDVLAQGKIKGAALDVFEVEPLPKNSKWRTTEWPESTQVVLSPHMGYVEEATMHGWYDDVADIIITWLKGEETTAQIN